MSLYSRKPGKGVMKYRNVKTVVDGIRFASKAEAKRYGELKMLERAGEIDTLELQPRIPLKVNGALITTYVADFRYRQRPSLLIVVEDVKGVETRAFKNKWKHAQKQHPIWAFRLVPA